MKITPIVIVERVEPLLPFWVDRLGFTKTIEMPEGNHLGFIILNHGSAELMIQTIESTRKDIPQFVPKTQADDVSLYIEVDDFADTLRRLEGYPIALPERTTFYGMREIGVRDPSGHAILFGARR